MNKTIEERLKAFEEKFVKTSMWELVPNTPRKIMMEDKDVAILMIDIKYFLKESMELAYLEGKLDGTNEARKIMIEAFK